MGAQDRCLAASYSIVAPDCLGFGHTEKLYDFAGGSERGIRHLRRFLSYRYFFRILHG
jgi:hypothetical protein